MASSTTGGGKLTSRRGGITGGIAPPQKKVDAFPLMTFVKNNCSFSDVSDKPVEFSEDALRSANNCRFHELLDQAAVMSSKSQHAPGSSSDSDSEERQKALRKMHEMEWKRNQNDTWKVQQPKTSREPDYGGFLRPLEKADIGEYFSGTKKSKQSKDHKRNRSVSEVLLLDDGKIMTMSGEVTSNSHSKQLVTNLPLRSKRPSVPSKGLPFAPGPPISNSNSVWKQRSGSELFNNVQSSTLTAYGVTGEEEEAMALAIAESIRTAKEEQNFRVNIQQMLQAQHRPVYEETKPLKVQRLPPDPVGTVWDVDTEGSSDEKPVKPVVGVRSLSSKGDDDLFRPRETPSFIGVKHKNKTCHEGDENLAFSAFETKNADSYAALPQRNQKGSVSALEPLTSDSESTSLKSSMKSSSLQKNRPRAPAVSFKLKDDYSDQDIVKQVSVESNTSDSIESSMCNKFHHISVSSSAHSGDDDYPEEAEEEKEMEVEEVDSYPQNSKDTEDPVEDSQTAPLSQPDSEEKSVRLPQTIPPSILALSSNKSVLKRSSHIVDSSAIMGPSGENLHVKPTTETAILPVKEDSLPSSPALMKNPPKQEHYDVNRNDEGREQQANENKQIPVNSLNTMPMIMPGIPWQYQSMPQINSGIPSLFAPGLPQFTSAALNMNPQLIPSVASQMATQAQLASMQMMLLQQAMGMPPIFQSPNQAFSLPQNTTTPVLPSPTLGFAVGPNGSGGNPMGFGLGGVQCGPAQQPNQFTQPGLLSVQGKGRGRLNRAGNTTQ